MNQYLVLRIEAPFGSFGTNESMRDRQTILHPTQSAVSGMLARCMGYDHNSREVVTICKNITASFACDNLPVILQDFQTVDPGLIYSKDGKSMKYDYRFFTQDFEKLNLKRSPGEKTTFQKYYLLNMSYDIAIKFKEEFPWDIRCVDNYCKYPEMFPWIGRKCCVPSVFTSSIVSVEDDFSALGEHDIYWIDGDSLDSIPENVMVIGTENVADICVNNNPLMFATRNVVKLRKNMGLN